MTPEEFEHIRDILDDAFAWQAPEARQQYILDKIEFMVESS